MNKPRMTPEQVVAYNKVCATCNVWTMATGVDYVKPTLVEFLKGNRHGI